MSQKFFGKKAYTANKLFGNLTADEKANEQEQKRNYARDRQSYFIDSILRIVNNSGKAKASHLANNSGLKNGRIVMNAPDEKMQRADIYITATNGKNSCIRIGASASQEKSDSKAANTNREHFFNVVSIEEFTNWFNQTYQATSNAGSSKANISKDPIKELRDASQGLANSVQKLKNHFGPELIKEASAFEKQTLDSKNKILDAEKKLNRFAGANFNQ